MTAVVVLAAARMFVYPCFAAMEPADESSTAATLAGSAIYGSDA